MNTNGSAKQSPDPPNLTLHRQMYEERLKKLLECGTGNGKDETDEIKQDREDEEVTR